MILDWNIYISIFNYIFNLFELIFNLFETYQHIPIIANYENLKKNKNIHHWINFKKRL